ncbi:MAG: hypothetical protein ACLFPP_13495, partial [Spirochaetaceae bacterium]
METEVGETMRFRAELDGYEPMERTVSVTAEMEPLVELALKEQLVTERIEVVTTPREAEISVNGERVGRGRYAERFETGRQITVTAEEEGPSRLTFALEEEPVYFTGSTEAVALSLATGEVLYRRSLGEESSHLFGRTVTPVGDGRFLFPD